MGWGLGVGGCRLDLGLGLGDPRLDGLELGGVLRLLLPEELCDALGDLEAKKGMINFGHMGGTGCDIWGKGGCVGVWGKRGATYGENEGGVGEFQKKGTSSRLSGIEQSTSV